MQVVRERFGEVVEEAAAGGLQQWRHGYEALAGVIVRDQFTRCYVIHFATFYV